jgi:hypothetical protein
MVHTFLNIFEYDSIEDMEPGQWIVFSDVRVADSSIVWPFATFYFGKAEDNLVLRAKNGTCETYTIGRPSLTKRS